MDDILLCLHHVKVALIGFGIENPVSACMPSQSQQSPRNESATVYQNAMPCSVDYIGRSGWRSGDWICSSKQQAPQRSSSKSQITEVGQPKTSASNKLHRDEHKIRRARTFTYEELERATGGFKEDTKVGKGSFSCVFKGILKDGTVVAVKRAIISTDVKKNSTEFHTELDLLSRLNHAHLLNLLGYCEEGQERLLVYEFMAHGSLHQHLHGKSQSLKQQLDWVRRVTIAVQAARGIEYLHGYACPPVIHRDIKSSNILIDEEHNARVADFGLSLLGPADSSSPLAELPTGTLGYLDPEYYRLHYLTTKSDVYSFGVLHLEILSGRKVIDMQFEEGNIVEWAVPQIKAGDIAAILDSALKPPEHLEALTRIANVACRCVRMTGKERPSINKVTTALEQALALLMGNPCNEQPILPTKVVLGSSRLHKSSRRSPNRSGSEATTTPEVIEADNYQRFEFRAPSWITFPSVASSQRRKSSASEDVGTEEKKQEISRQPQYSISIEYEDEDIWEEVKIEAVDGGVSSPTNIPKANEEKNRTFVNTTKSNNSKKLDGEEVWSSFTSIKRSLMAEAPVMPWGSFLDDWGGKWDVLANQRGLELEG
ncbi:hypothetical protein IFM89_006324 [Coptis chinensis]|uniref:non-specific serine/threonine protein kinase n=1 Tax=Coptis chinensis TaxID=261450 RepID=A0A835LYQ1_9MAGN|nr:hypothetical protein IFM89_006324 [Coptis chinensis]